MGGLLNLVNMVERCWLEGHSSTMPGAIQLRRPGVHEGSPTHIPKLKKKLRKPFPGGHLGGRGYGEGLMGVLATVTKLEVEQRLPSMMW